MQQIEEEIEFSSVLKQLKAKKDQKKSIWKKEQILLQ